MVYGHLRGGGKMKTKKPTIATTKEYQFTCDICNKVIASKSLTQAEQNFYVHTLSHKKYKEDENDENKNQ